MCQSFFIEETTIKMYGRRNQNKRRTWIRREVLEEIVQRTMPTAQREGISIDIYFERDERAQTDALRFGEAKADYEMKTGTVIIPSATRKAFSQLALKGLLYSLIGQIFGLYTLNPDEEARAILFSEEKRPQREAVFDYMMLQDGGTVEALVAYKVESVRRTMEMVVRHGEEMEFNRGAFAVYCKQLDQLQENLGSMIYSLALQGTRAKPVEKRYEN